MEIRGYFGGIGLSNGLWSLPRIAAQRVHHCGSRKWFSLDDEQEVLGRWRSTDGLYSVQTGGTEGIEAHAVLRVFQMLGELGPEQDEFLPGQEALEERVLRPLAEALKNLVDFGPSAIIGNIVGDDVTGDLAPDLCCFFHS